MSLQFELFWFVAMLGAVIATAWWSRTGSAGLGIAYMISLGYIHFWGGLIHTLPWYYGGDEVFTKSGFDEFTWGVTFFAVGYCILLSLLWRFVPIRRAKLAPGNLSSVCILSGALLYGVLRGALSGIPSISALTTCGGALYIAGLCLVGWDGWRRRQFSRLILSLLSLVILPFFTIVTDGFFGYGAAAALVVVSFVSCLLRPRVAALVFLGGIIYFGSCVFMTYMRDRDDIRYEVWEEDSSLSQRADRMRATFTNFDTLDFSNQDQLDRIEARLNQNDLVGRAVSMLESGDVSFANGETFRQAAIAIVPRIFWRSKPVTAGSPDIVSYFTGLYFAPGTCVGIGQVMEGYVNFGTPGVIGIFVIFGLALGMFDRLAAVKLRNGDTLEFVKWFVPGIGLLQPGGSLVEVVATVAASFVLVWMFGLPFRMRAKKAGDAKRQPLAPWAVEHGMNPSR